MRKKSTVESGIFHPRVFIAFILGLTGVSLAVFSSAGPAPITAPPALPTAPLATPTFGHPVMAGIGGSGNHPARGLTIFFRSPSRPPAPSILNHSVFFI
jgi:hypothetical protein